MSSRLGFVQRVVALFADAGVEVWLFGGWAEEVLGLSEPRPHADVDLLYVGESFERVDEVGCSLQLEEIRAEHFRHKRAFVVDGVMVELFLVQQDEEGYYTDFWGATRHRWPGRSRVARERPPGGEHRYARGLSRRSRQPATHFDRAFVTLGRSTLSP